MTTIPGVRPTGPAPAGPSLEPATLFPEAPVGRRAWRLTAFPQCGEATLVYSDGTAPRRRLKVAAPFVGEPHTWLYLDTGEVAPPPDEERARQEAGRRARKTLRRFCVANLLTTMVTLTFAQGSHDRQSVLDAMAAFVERWQAHVGRTFPYAYVLEKHPQGHGWHIHVACRGRTTHRALMLLWGNGIVWEDDGRGKASRWQGMASAIKARCIAGYLAKYLVKSMDTDREKGARRFSTAHGFQPDEVRMGARDLREAEEALLLVAGPTVSALNVVWASPPAGPESLWKGPPTVTVEWSRPSGSAPPRRRAAAVLLPV